MKKNDKAKTELLEQLRKTPIIQIACEKLGINRTTLYRWRAENKEFAKAIDEALLEGRLMVNDLAESQLIGAVKDRNITAILAWLKHNHPTYRTRIEIEGSLKVIDELSPEQAEQVRRALALADVTLKSHE
jgi:ACT domain-containing protein